MDIQLDCLLDVIARRIGSPMRGAPAAPFSRVDPKGNFARLDPSRGSELSMMASDLEFAARDAAIRFEIALAGSVHHAGGQRRRRGVAVPAAGVAFGVEIITQRLLVETRLRLAGLVDIDRPEPRTVGGPPLVDQDDAPTAVATEFEFCVGDDDAAVARDGFAEIIDGARHALQRVGDLLAQDLAYPRHRDVLVMPGFGLGLRAENRGLELCA